MTPSSNPNPNADVSSPSAPMSSAALQPEPGTAVSRFFSDGYVATWRNIKKIVRVPDILVFTLIQPIMFVLLFTFVFGSSIDVPGESYTSFLMAGIFAQNNVNVTSLNQMQLDHPFTTYEVDLQVQDLAHLTRILSALRASDSVAQAERI